MLRSPNDFPEGIWKLIAHCIGRCIVCEFHSNWRAGGFPVCLHCPTCWQMIVESSYETGNEPRADIVDDRVHVVVRGQFAHPDDSGTDFSSDGNYGSS